ncbi:hypothetical protein JL09_g6332 [Pichia kudriavzevii]|uniref:Uncharacterized protein n=1 Tax=Pichia kudriavzevii TaxID=4909 RepID=A0A099NPR5_PICKU|nr:hypothetical protein JL09_g6332 [Pichia kudriavzevii]
MGTATVLKTIGIDQHQQ